MVRPASFCLAALLLLTGCFPLELDVNSRGELLVCRQEGFFLIEPATNKVSKVADAVKVPVFARFHPSERYILLVEDQTRAADSMRYDLLDLRDGSRRTIFEKREAAYAMFSPDGRRLASVNVVHRPTGKGTETRGSELFVISIPGGRTELIAVDVAPVFRWLPDSKRLLLLKVKSRDPDHFDIGAELGILHVETRHWLPVAATIIDERAYLDLSPDGTKAMLRAEDLVLAPAEPKRTRSEALFEVDLREKRIRRFGWCVLARYSPSGRKLLLATPTPDYTRSEHYDLRVGDATAGAAADVAPNALDAAFPVVVPGALVGGPELKIPGWIDDERLYYFRQRYLFGAGGETLCLCTAKVDGSAERNLQPYLEQKAYETPGNDLPPDPEEIVLERPAHVPPRPEQVPHFEELFAGTCICTPIVFVVGLSIGVPWLVKTVVRRRRAATEPIAPAADQPSSEE